MHCVIQLQSCSEFQCQCLILSPGSHPHPLKALGLLCYVHLGQESCPQLEPDTCSSSLWEPISWMLPKCLHHPGLLSQSPSQCTVPNLSSLQQKFLRSVKMVSLIHLVNFRSASYKVPLKVFVGFHSITLRRSIIQWLRESPPQSVFLGSNLSSATYNLYYLGNWQCSTTSFEWIIMILTPQRLFGGHKALRTMPGIQRTLGFWGFFVLFVF